MMSDTPRTDAFWMCNEDPKNREWMEFSRQIERELNMARAQPRCVNCFNLIPNAAPQGTPGVPDESESPAVSAPTSRASV
jgi:hypothetical protein